MIPYRRRKQAQSVVEWAIMASLVAVAIIGMNVYLMRSSQGYVKRSVDSMGGELYSPKHSVYTKATVSMPVLMDQTVGNHSVNIGNATHPQMVNMYQSSRSAGDQVSATVNGSILQQQTGETYAAVFGGMTQVSFAGDAQGVFRDGGSTRAMDDYTFTPRGAVEQKTDDSYTDERSVWQESE